MSGQHDAEGTSEGFSTIEVLVAFAILSLGLGLAVQNISQSSLSLRQARAEGENKRVLQQVLSVELPSLLERFNGSALSATAEGWDLVVEPLMTGNPKSALRVVARIKSGSQSHAAIYTTIVAPTLPELLLPPAVGGM